MGANPGASVSSESNEVAAGITAEGPEEAQMRQMYKRSYLTDLQDGIARSKNRRDITDAINKSLGDTAQSPRSKRGSGSGSQPDTERQSGISKELAKSSLPVSLGARA